MNTNPADPRDELLQLSKQMKELVRAQETSRALKAHADEIGISQSALLRLCWLKCHREQHAENAIGKLLDSGSAATGRN